jgi:Ser/Thr protein kinase RdoA (MazF antagonist)
VDYDGGFDELTPEICLEAVEAALDTRLDGTLSSYPSYVNRVYGLTDENGTDLVAKFYRPGRWSAEAIREEHRFLLDCAEADIPVVVPIENVAGERLSSVHIDEAAPVHFAVFPKMGGRSFDPETDDAWLRLGGIIGRVHLAGRAGSATHRPVCLPDSLTGGYVRELVSQGVVHPDVQSEFEDLCRETIERIGPLFAGTDLQRVHGDCHRGNFLDRLDEGLLVIDFDDMMIGPPVHDIWLMLPDHLEESRREINLLLEGYDRFCDFDMASLKLVEPLRFMRMIYFLTWRARQRHDHWFAHAFPDWGGKQFWIKEVEDLRLQSRRILG